MTWFIGLGLIRPRRVILGEEGRLEETEQIMAEIDKLKFKKEELMQIGDGTNLINNKLMKVCEVCGALQAINDTERRQTTHLEGKLHTGFAILRKEQAALKIQKDKVTRMIDEQEKDDLDRKSGVRRRSKSKGRRSKSRSRNRSGSRKKGKKNHKRSSSRSRSRSEERRKDKRRRDDDRNHHNGGRDRERRR